MNSIVKLARSQFPDDERDDKLITLEFGRWAEQNRPDWFEQFPDFAEEYREIQRSLRPGLGQEFKAAAGAAVDNLQATAFGAGGMAADLLGADRVKAWMMEKSLEQQAEAAEYRPSVGTYKDVESGGDLLHYLAYGMGTVAPSVAEAVILGAAGAAAGSAAAPGPGTAAGAVAGLVGRQAARNLIRAHGAQWAKGLSKEAAEAALKSEMKSVAASAGGRIGLAASSIPHAQGEIYNDIADTENGAGIAAVAGTFAGLLDLLPEAYVFNRFFKPGTKIAPESGSRVMAYVKRLGAEAAKTMPMEASTESAQEFIGWAAEKYARNEPPTVTDKDVEHFINAGLIGAMGGGVFAPISAFGRGRTMPEIPEGQQEQQNNFDAPPPPPEITPFDPPESQPAYPFDPEGSPDAVAPGGSAPDMSRLFSEYEEQTRPRNEFDAIGQVREAVQRAAAAESQQNAAQLFQEQNQVQAQLLAQQARQREAAAQGRALMGDLPATANRAPAAIARQHAERTRTAPVEDEFTVARRLLNPPVATPAPAPVAPASPTPSPAPVGTPAPSATPQTTTLPAPIPVTEPTVTATASPDPTVPQFTNPAQLVGLNAVRDLRTENLTPQQRVQEVTAIAGKNKKNAAGAVIILDRGTGRVHQRRVYKGDRGLMLEMSQQRGTVKGVANARRNVDLDAPSTGGPLSAVLAEVLPDQSPRYEIVGTATYANPAQVASLAFDSPDTLFTDPDVIGLIPKRMQDEADIGQRTRGRRPDSNKKVSFDTLEAVISDDSRAGVPMQGSVEEATTAADPDAEAQSAGRRTVSAEPTTDFTVNTSHSVRLMATEAAAQLKAGRSEAQVREALTERLKKLGITDKQAREFGVKGGLKSLTDYLMQIGIQIAEVEADFTVRARLPWRTPPVESNALFDRLVEAIRASGGEVSIFQGNLDTEVAAWMSAYGLQLSTPDNRSLIGLGLQSINDRSPQATLTLIHEAAHHFLNRLLPDPALRNRYEHALDQLPAGKQRWLLNPLSTDLRLLANAQPENLTTEQQAILAALPPDALAKLRATDPTTLLVEQGAEHLAMLGVDRAQARSIISQIIRAVKDLLLRIGMAIQKTLKGPDAVSDRLVTQFVENRWLQFINRDFATGPMAITSLRNWIGAPPTFRERVASQPNYGGGDPRVGHIDIETGQWYPTDFIPMDVAGMRDKIQAAISTGQVMAHDAASYTFRGPIGKHTIKLTPETQLNAQFAYVNYLRETVNALYSRVSPVVNREVREAENPAAFWAARYLRLSESSHPDALHTTLTKGLSTAPQLNPLTGQPAVYNPQTQIRDLVPTQVESLDAHGRARMIELNSARDYALKAALTRLHQLRTSVANRLAADKEEFERLGKRKNLTDSEKRRQTEVGERAAMFERILNEKDVGLRWRVGDLESRLDVATHDTYYPGANYRVPANNTVDPEAFAVFQLPKDMRFTPETKKRFIKHLAEMRRWLDNEENKKYGADYGRILHQWNRLNEGFSTEYVYTPVNGTLRKTFVKSLVDMLRYIGSPNAVHASQRINKFAASINAGENDARTLGGAWAESFQKFAKALNRRVDAAFEEQVWDSLSRTLEQINEGTTNAVELGRTALRQKYDIDITEKAMPAFRDLVRVTRQNQQWRAKVQEEQGLLVADDGLTKAAGGDRKLHRRLIQIGFFNGQRSTSRVLDATYLQMRDRWSMTDEKSKTHPASDLGTTLESNPALGEEFIRTMFTTGVINNFVDPLMRNNAPFITLRDSDGFTRQAQPYNVSEAWRKADGDIRAFAKELHRLEQRTTPEANTLNDVMEGLLTMFGSVKAEAERRAGAESSMEITPRQMMDGRQADNWPAEWVSYGKYDATSNHVFLMQSAINGAFGRNGFGPTGEFAQSLDAVTQDIRALQAQEAELRKNEGLPPAEVEKRMGKGQYAIARHAEDHLHMLGSMHDKLKAITKTTGYQLGDMRTFANTLNMIAGLSLQQPRSAMMNLSDLLAPFYNTKFSTTSLKMVGRNFQSLFRGGADSLLQAMGVEAHLNTDYAMRRRNTGYYDSANYVSWKQNMADAKSRFMAPDRPETLIEQASRGVNVGIRGARSLIDVGRQDAMPNTADKALSVKFRPAGVFTWLSQVMLDAQVDGLYDGVADLVARGIEMIGRAGGIADQRRLVQALESGDAQIDPHDLGYSRKFLIFNDRAAYDYLADALTTKMGERSVENFIAQAWRRRDQSPDGKWEAITDKQFIALANVAANEFSLKAGVGSAPIDMMTSPGLRMLSVFLTWPWMAMVRGAKSFRTPQGEITWASALDGMTLMMMGAIPATLAGSLMVDFYDEKIVGKKSNIRDIDATALIPGYGVASQPMAVLERLARYGTFGLASEAVNGVINFDDARGGFTPDTRIFVFAKFNDMRNITTSLWNQDGQASYESVWRPLMSFIGLNGALQYTQIANQALGSNVNLSDREAAINERINGANYLRAAGRALSLDVRTSKGMQSAATPLTPWLRQMELAGVTGDYQLFREAYARAIQQASKMGKEDPVQHVREGFAARHPLRRIFRTLPSESEYRNILASLDETGRQAVTKSVGSYNLFLSERLGLKPVLGKKEAARSPFAAPATRAQEITLEQARAMAAEAAFGRSIFGGP